MPRYFFHVFDDMEALDEEGDHFPNVEAALKHAYVCARSLLADDVLKGTINLRHRIEIADEQGALIVTVFFADAVTITGWRTPKTD